MAKQEFTECPRRWFMRQHSTQTVNAAAIRHAIDLARIASRMAVSWSFAGYPEVASEWRAKRDHYLRTAYQLKADQPRTMEPKQ